MKFSEQIKTSHLTASTRNVSDSYSLYFSTSLTTLRLPQRLALQCRFPLHLGHSSTNYRLPALLSNLFSTLKTLKCLKQHSTTIATNHTHKKSTRTSNLIWIPTPCLGNRFVSAFRTLKPHKWDGVYSWHLMKNVVADPQANIRPPYFKAQEAICQQKGLHQLRFRGQGWTCLMVSAES